MRSVIAAGLGALGFAGAASLAAASTPAAVASGRLEGGGGYLSPAPGATVSALSDGSVLLFGFGPSFDERLSHRDLAALLRTRREAPALAAPDPDPKLWDSAAQGWKRLPRPATCAGPKHYLHTATVLPDDRVLVAGGLCDAPKFADDATPWPAHTRTTLWDPRARAWLEGPALREARIHHTATAMADGSVILAGGMADPLIAPSAETLLRSVERFASGSIEALPALIEIRARHTATALADGSLLVAGGVGQDGRALSSVEILTPGANAWRALPPMQQARYGHTATLTADGRILVVGGKDGQERALHSTETWDPQAGRWHAGPDLPVALNGHAAARLPGGEILVAGGAWIASPLAPIPWAWTWSSNRAEWTPAATAMPRDATDLAGGVTIAPRSNDAALIFTSRTILRWRAGAADEGPRWDMRPAITALRGGRALVVGYAPGSRPNTALAHVWDAASRRWSPAGAPFGGERMDSAVGQLASGRVISVGIDTGNHLLCRMWDPPERWDDCGSLELEYPRRGRPQLGTLPDGRTFAITGEHEAAIFDEGARGWKRARLDWNRAGFAYGAPVRMQHALARLTDPATGTAIAIDEAAARYYNASLSGGNVALLWDARASHWAYVLRGGAMGSEARWLPDGCALSMWPLALFDPRRAEPRALGDPGLGIEPHQGAMAVLDDGTVVAAGVSAAGTSGFFHRRASCAGFVTAGDSGPYIAPDAASPPPPVRAIAAAAPAGDSWMAKARTWAWNWRWPLAALLIPAALHFLLRRTRIGRARAPASRGFRIAIYAILAVVLAPFVLQFVAFRVATTGSQCLESPIACDREPPWWLGLLRKLDPPPLPPCDLIGVWGSQRNGRVDPVELREDGTYEMKADGRTYRGLWRLEGDRMIWHHETTPGVRDVNPLVRLDVTRFQLTEENGGVTLFQRIRSVPAAKCTP